MHADAVPSLLTDGDLTVGRTQPKALGSEGLVLGIRTDARQVQILQFLAHEASRFSGESPKSFSGFLRLNLYAFAARLLMLFLKLQLEDFDRAPEQ
jgi:hypothetical protein